LILWNIVYIVSFHLPFVAFITEVSCAPAEKLSDGTTKLALEVYEFLSMLFTALNTSTDELSSRAFTAY
jgi:hypothetical protein